MEKYSSKLSYLLDYLSRSSPLRHFEQSFWLNMLFGLEAVHQSLWLLLDREVAFQPEEQ